MKNKIQLNKLIISLLLIVVISCISYICMAQNSNCLESKVTVSFDFETYKNPCLSKYLDAAWNNYFCKEIPQELINKFKLSKKNIGIIVTDLNNDNKFDVIATTEGIPYYCGKMGEDRPLVVLLFNPINDNYKTIYVEAHQIDNLPVIITSTVTNCLESIIINKKLRLKFDGEKYKICN